MNKLIIVGKLGQDASVKNVEGKDVVNFTVAVNEYQKTTDGGKKSLTTWFECSYWQNSKIAQYLSKGATVAVEGKVAAVPYKDKDNNPKASLRLLVKEIQLISTAASKDSDIPDDLPELD